MKGLVGVPVFTIGETTLVTPGAAPEEAEVMRPCWSITRLAYVYDPEVTPVSDKAIVPAEVIIPPVNPVPAVTAVTVPLVTVPEDAAVIRP
jgi:hypothetical protein